jgi:hypothetical protein
VYSNRFSNTRYRMYLELRDRNSTLSGLAGFQGQSFGFRIDGETEHLFGEIVTGEYFSILDVIPAHGRLLVPTDDRPGASPSVVLSHAFWIRRFARAADAVGRTTRLNNHAFTIVGVAPEGFTGVLGPIAGDLWVPVATDALLRPAPEPAAGSIPSAYGVLSLLVRSRTREIGVRVAAGATPAAVAALVIRQALAWTVTGAVLGIGLALVLTRFLAAFLYGISPTDPWTFGGVALLLAAVATTAAAGPAVRASHVDPLVALRSE